MKVSAVITCYESFDTIGLTILSLAAQSRRPEEIIVTDDGSGKHTCRYVKQLLDSVSVSHSIHTDFVTHERTTPYRLNTVRNKGISRASGDIIFLFDGDIFVPGELVESHEKIHVMLSQDARRAYISSIRKNLSGKGILETSRISEWGLQLDQFLLSKQWQDLDLEPEQVISQASFLKSDWKKVGGFDTDFDGHWGYDEIEFAHRLKTTGTMLTSNGIVFHLTVDAALDNRDRTRNREVYLQKKNEWLKRINTNK